jgi:3-isopropylmalate dehydrogenase
MSSKRYIVACLAGDGIGPEVMAQASRLVSAVSRLHGFTVDELHVPLGSEALHRFGHPLPRATRDACLSADAILAASPHEPALERLELDLDLRASVTSLRFAPRGDVLLLSPLDADASRWTVERAFELARRRRARVASVARDRAWHDLVEGVAHDHDGLAVEHMTVASALPALAFDRERFDVVVTDEVLADAVTGVAASEQQGPRVIATGRLAAHGPSMFLAAHGAAHAIAGQGVANPSSILLAAALMLGAGLGEHSAAETLHGAVLRAFTGSRTADMRGRGLARTTRDFASVVLRELPSSLPNAEFHREAYA